MMRVVPDTNVVVSAAEGFARAGVDKWNPGGVVLTKVMATDLGRYPRMA